MDTNSLLSTILSKLDNIETEQRRLRRAHEQQQVQQKELKSSFDGIQIHNKDGNLSQRKSNETLEQMQETSQETTHFVRRVQRQKRVDTFRPGKDKSHNVGASQSISQTSQEGVTSHKSTRNRYQRRRRDVSLSDNIEDMESKESELSTRHARTNLELQDMQQQQHDELEDVQMQVCNNSKQLRQIKEQLHNQTNWKQYDDLNQERRTLFENPHSDSSSEDEKIRNDEFEKKCMAKAIKTYMVEIVECLPFGESEIPDLIIPECVSENECESIRKKHNRKDQVRTLVRIVISRSYKAMLKLLESICQHNRTLATRINDTYKKHVVDRTDVEKTCTVCMISNHVNIKDVCDFFYAKDMISDVLHGIITDTQLHEGNQNNLWNILLEQVSSIPVSLVLNIVVEALTAKGTVFSNIIRIIKRDIEKKRGLTCMCQARQIMPVSRESITSDTASSTNTSLNPRSSYSIRSFDISSETSSSSSTIGLYETENEETDVKQIANGSSTPQTTDDNIQHTMYESHRGGKGSKKRRLIDEEHGTEQQEHDCTRRPGREDRVRRFDSEKRNAVFFPELKQEHGTEQQEHDCTRRPGREDRVRRFDSEKRNAVFFF